MFVESVPSAADVCGRGIVRELHRPWLRLARQIRMLGTSIGKYRIVGSLGRGATGVVYRAVDETLGRQVAIKLLTSEAAESDLMKRFRNEATALAKLNHPGIATIYELFTSGPDLLMVMEFVPGQTLEQLSNREGPIAPDRAVYLVDAILSALEHAHRAGIIHRDMKPANVMVSQAGGVKIMDFGIARVRGVEHFTVDGCLMGTPAYMSPEHVRGEQVDERADLYAVGVIFYRLLTGRLPFDADSTVVMLQKHVSEVPTALHAHRADLPRWCESIVQRAMAKAPAKRFQTAREFRTALRRAAGAASARPPSSATSRWPIAFGSIALVASLLLLVHVAARGAISPPVNRRADPPAALAAARVLPATAAVATLPNEPERAAAPPPVVNPQPVVVARPVVDRPVVATREEKTYPARTFLAKGLVDTGEERRVRDVRLVLTSKSITVSDDATRKRLQVVPFDDVRAITYSHGRDPMWNSSGGPTPIVRTSGRFSRVLGIGGNRHWISLIRTDRRFVILRVDDSQVGDVLSALEERTGQTPQLLESRKGAD
jgi:serine/threonine protein kinase